MQTKDKKALATGAGIALFAALAVSSVGVRAEPTAAAPDLALGKQAFAPCMVCHRVTKGDNAIGPSLYKVVGRKVATAPGFNYSPAMKAHGGAWTPEKLDAYLTNPRQVVPGTLMSYPGQKDPAKRAALIAYLKTLK